MKAIKFYEMIVVAIITCFAFASCGGDDENETPVTLEGTWYLKTEQWWSSSDRSIMINHITYDDYSNTRIWALKKKGETYTVTVFKEGEYHDTYDWLKLGNNEYEKYNDRLVVKSVTSKLLIIDIDDNYLSENEEYKEYGTYTFMR